MIKINYIGRLGNNIFQYCLGRIIGEELGYSIDNNLELFKNAIKINGSNFSNPIEILNGHDIRFQEIINNKNPRMIILDGFFQRIEYYVNYKYKILNWLSLEDKNFRKPNKNDLVVHIRGGDLFHKNPNSNQVPAPIYYYINNINLNNYEKLYFVCENPDDLIVKELKKIYLNAEIISQSPIEDYYFINNSNNIILSLSTLSWWAAFLSQAEKIYFPMTGFWHPKGERKDVNLLVNEKRYIYCDLGIKDDWVASEDQINSLLIKDKNFNYYNYDQII